MNKELDIRKERMNKVTRAMEALGWTNLGPHGHPIKKYPDCPKCAKGGKELFVAPAFEDYRCAKIWRNRECIGIVNTVTMNMVDGDTTNWKDSNEALADFLNRC